MNYSRYVKFNSEFIPVDNVSTIVNIFITNKIKELPMYDEKYVWIEYVIRYDKNNNQLYSTHSKEWYS